MICLLDDDPAVLKGMSRLLSSADWQVKQFSDPETFWVTPGLIALPLQSLMSGCPR